MNKIKHILISFSILCFGFATFGISGYCASSLSIAPSAVPTFEAFSQGMASGGFAYGNPVIMTTEALNNINMNLYKLYGYDLVDLSNDVWNSISDPTEWYNNLTKYASGEATVDGSRVDTSVANRIAQRISQGALTGAVTAKNLIDTGYRYFSTSVPQWGENAKQFFIGKVDEATQQIVDVAPTMVTKITAEGLMAYNQVYNNLVNNGSLTEINSYMPIYSSTFKLFYPAAYNNLITCELHFPSNVLSFVYKPGANPTTGNANIYFAIPETYISGGDYGYVSNISGFLINSSGTYEPIESAYIYYGETIQVNGISYRVGYMYINSKLLGITKPVGNIYPEYSTLQSFLEAYFNNSPTVLNAYSYDYISSSLSQALKTQLDRLIGKYVDSLILGRINDIIASIPIGQELVGETDVPVAIPTQEVVDELTGVIDDALDLDEDYALAFDDAYAAEIETTPEPNPNPYPNNTGTAIPEGFPEAPIFDPIVDIVKTPFSFFSIFEPIFQVFGASFNFFGVWLCFPVVLIILLIIWALK